MGNKKPNEEKLNRRSPKPNVPAVNSLYRSWYQWHMSILWSKSVDTLGSPLAVTSQATDSGWTDLKYLAYKYSKKYKLESWPEQVFLFFFLFLFLLLLLYHFLKGTKSIYIYIKKGRGKKKMPIQKLWYQSSDGSVARHLPFHRGHRKSSPSWCIGD